MIRASHDRSVTLKMSGSAVALLICAVFSTVWGAENVPVVMWGSSEIESSVVSPLNRISGGEFSRIVTKAALGSDAFVVAFIEETLSVEDLSRKDTDGGTPFRHLRRRAVEESFAYLPAVRGAAEELEAVAEETGVDRVRMTDDGLTADTLPGPGKFLVVSLQDAREGEDRSKMLARHDSFMKEMYDKLSRKRRNVVAIYTARRPSWEVTPPRSGRVGRQLQQTEPEPQPISGFYNASNKVYLYAPSIMLVMKDKTEELADGTVTLNATDSEYQFNIAFANDTRVQFIFTLDRGYWYMEKATVNRGSESATELKSVDIYAPVGFSYHCGQSVYYKSYANNESMYLELKNFQAQIFTDRSPSRNRFESPYDCVGVMTVPIWSGIVLLAILVIIISGGVTMMMDIRTMDRFDDPKGKTITINAAE